MKHVSLGSLFVLSLGMLLTPVLAQDTDNLSTEQRLERLERLVDSQGLADILMRLNSLEQEVRELRGKSEEQAHTIKQLKERQRELYIDLDRRLLSLERGDGGTVSSEAGESASSRTTTRPAGKPTVSTSVTDVRSKSEKDEPNMSAAPVAQTEQEAYQEAFNLLRDRKYDSAIEVFQRFLQNYPNGRYAHIARYWLGEANYAQRHYRQAIGDYQDLIDRYPNSPKVAEAMLKIGYSHNRLEEDQAASKVLEKLISNYPGTTEASQARNLLQKIRAKSSN